MDTLPQLPLTSEGLLDTRELARTLLESVVNEVMDGQADALCEDGANCRNGYRERGLATPVGTITLRIPKLRAGSYFPEGLLERYSRSDRAVIAAVSEIYASGVSTRKVAKTAQKLGMEKLSKDQVSSMCKSLDTEVSALSGRRLDIEYPYVFLDATYIKCRREGRVQSTAVVTAIGVGSDGVRRFLGLGAIDTETYAGWLGFLRSLRERGLGGVRCVTSDAHAGLVRAIAECFPGACWQRCIVHLERDVCSLLSAKRSRAMAGKALQAVFKQADPATARSAYGAAIDEIANLSGDGARLLEDAEADALAYLDFPEAHRRRIRTNNIQERMNREIKRRSRVVQVFPSIESMLRLVGAVCAEQDEDWLSRRYIVPESLTALFEPAPQRVEETDESRQRGLKIVKAAMDLVDQRRRAA